MNQSDDIIDPIIKTALEYYDENQLNDKILYNSKSTRRKV
jgi:hypothetical protein